MVFILQEFLRDPKDIPDAVAQASGAAARAAIPMVKGEVEIEPIIACVDSDVCGG